MIPFLVSSYFATHPITLLIEILKGCMHGPSPHLKFLGPSPLSSSQSPPMVACMIIVSYIFILVLYVGISLNLHSAFWELSDHSPNCICVYVEQARKIVPISALKNRVLLFLLTLISHSPSISSHLSQWPVILYTAWHLTQHQNWSSSIQVSIFHVPT